MSVNFLTWVKRMGKRLTPPTTGGNTLEVTSDKSKSGSRKPDLRHRYTRRRDGPRAGNPRRSGRDGDQARGEHPGRARLREHRIERTNRQPGHPGHGRTCRSTCRISKSTAPPSCPTSTCGGSGPARPIPSSNPSVASSTASTSAARPSTCTGSWTWNVEALRGPQGTLFGKNTVAGALIINTADPTDTFESGLSVSASSYSTTGGNRQLQGFVVGAAWREPCRTHRRPAREYRRVLHHRLEGPGGPNGSDTGVRMKLAWTPTDRTSVGLKVEFDRFDSEGPDTAEIADVGGPPCSSTRFRRRTSRRRWIGSSTSIARTLSPTATRMETAPPTPPSTRVRSVPAATRSPPMSR